MESDVASGLASGSVERVWLQVVVLSGLHRVRFTDSWR